MDNNKDNTVTVKFDLDKNELGYDIKIGLLNKASQKPEHRMKDNLNGNYYKPMLSWCRFVYF